MAHGARAASAVHAATPAACRGTFGKFNSIGLVITKDERHSEFGTHGRSCRIVNDTLYDSESLVDTHSFIRSFIPSFMSNLVKKLGLAKRERKICARLLM